MEKKPRTVHVYEICASSLDTEYPVWGNDRFDRFIKVRNPGKYTSPEEEQTWHMVKEDAEAALDNRKMVSPLKGDRLIAVRYSYKKSGQKFMKCWVKRSLVDE